MSLLSDLTPPKRRWPCAVRTLLETLEPTDSTILAQAVMNPDWKYLALETALALKGVVLSQGSIKRHRTGLCSC